MAKTNKALTGKQKRFGLLRPLVWAILSWMFFEHAKWVPEWTQAVWYTVVAIVGIAVVVQWFTYEEVELEFHDDGRVTWKKVE